ncbi:hypothetical protein SLEP1_g52372 [Rubroshorea leprosula]|uniref:Uncharacterized protein n=1 Tax=Rubroshorea leprosula TaxID=152421 RepID=A0AAV5IT62_9ROSI|nr:hypothetical protein SLEP1_g15394 [Rubroshorea leprosula]GKV27148.1 hypothetical protein SLEP1_g36351 [Rubroshorea leprosula]GKV45264.1 hypothetical protein SLEP1_g52372 [Rubroshorea leprosula]
MYTNQMFFSSVTMFIKEFPFLPIPFVFRFTRPCDANPRR